MDAFKGGVGIAAGLAQVVYLGVAFVLAGHLLRRAYRQRELAPFLLGLNLLLAIGFGYVLAGVGMALAQLAESRDPGLVMGFLGAGYAVTIVGLTAAGIFQWRVFWPDRRWPLGVVGTLVAAMVLGLAGHAASGGLAAGSYLNPWAWLMTAGMVGINLWVGIEPLTYYAKLRKRIPLGLAEPLVADRFLLWGLGSLCRTAMVFLGPLAEFSVARSTPETEGAVVAGTLVCAALLGLTTSVSYWLTFNPTPAYVRWVERRYGASAPA